MDITPTVALVKQADVEFYGDSLIGALAEDGDIYMSLSQMCNSLNLQLAAQVNRIKRTEALADGLRLIRLTAADGKQRELTCLRVDLVPGWLAGITTTKVEDEALRKKLVTYQRDLYRVAWAVFGPLQAEVVPTSEFQAMAGRMNELTDRMETIDQVLVEIRRSLASAMADQERKLQVMHEGLRAEMDAFRATLADLETRSATAFKVVGERLKRLEVRLNPGAQITEEQAARIKEAVTYVANALQERGKQHAYAEVWAAFKQHFSLTEYRNLPQGRFAEALEWLSRWGAAVLASPKPVPPP